MRRQRGPPGFKVLEFLPQAVAKDREDLVSPLSLGIHPRDLSLFQTGGGMATQRATITVRENAIFIRTEAVRIVSKMHSLMCIACLSSKGASKDGCLIFII